MTPGGAACRRRPDDTRRALRYTRRVHPLTLVCAALIALAPRPAAASDTLLVWFGSPAPAAPFASWETAARAIQEAIDAADSGDCVLVRADTSRAYSGARTRCIRNCGARPRTTFRAVLFPRNGVAIRGEEPGPLPIVSGGDTTRTVAWTEGARHVVLERLRFRDGGMLFYGSADTTAAVRRSVFESCEEDFGGALRIEGEAAPLIEENLFLENAAENAGLHNSGGAIGLMGSIPAPVPVLRNNVFVRNRAGRGGGAIRVKWSNPVIVGNLFEGNVSRGDGGAIIIQGGRPRITGNLFRRNRAGGAGGAVAIYEGYGFGNVKVLFNLFEADSAAFGGAIRVSHGGNRGGEMRIVNNTFHRCRAESLGDAIGLDGSGLPSHRVVVNRNIFAAGEGAVSRFIASRTTGSSAAIDSLCCNAFWAETNDLAFRSEDDFGAVDSNLYADPGFVPGDTLRAIAPDSPCAPRASPCRALIGARSAE